MPSPAAADQDLASCMIGVVAGNETPQCAASAAGPAVTGFIYPVSATQVKTFVNATGWGPYAVVIDYVVRIDSVQVGTGHWECGPYTDVCQSPEKLWDCGDPATNHVATIDVTASGGPYNESDWNMTYCN